VKTIRGLGHFQKNQGGGGEGRAKIIPILFFSLGEGERGARSEKERRKRRGKGKDNRAAGQLSHHFQRRGAGCVSIRRTRKIHSLGKKKGLRKGSGKERGEPGGEELGWKLSSPTKGRRCRGGNYYLSRAIT